MTFRTLILFTLAATIGPAIYAAAAADGLTVDAAVDLALANQPGLRASSARRDAAAGRADQARTWPNPELTLNAEDWPVKSGRGISESKQTVGLSQTIPFPGKKPLDRQIGASGVMLSEAERNVVRLKLVRDVKTAFVRVLAAERLVEAANEQVRVAEASGAAARQRVGAGAAGDQEQLRAEISVEEARLELAGFRRDVLTTRENLALLLGQPETCRVPLQGSLAETAGDGLSDTKTEPGLTEHPGLVAARADRARAELEWRRARLEPYPDVRVEVAGGRIGDTGESIVQLGFALPLPLVDRSRGRAAEAQANVRAADADLLAAEQRLRSEWRVARQRLRTASDQVTRYRENILPRAAEALRLVRSGFEQGKFGFTDWLDTQRTSAGVRLAYVRALLELNEARVELETLQDPPGAVTSAPASSLPSRK